MKGIPQQKCYVILNESISSIFVKTPKFLQQAIGLRECAVLSNLLEKWVYFFSKNMLKEDNSFYLLQKYQALEIGISEYEITQAKRKLKTLGLIRTIKKGIPAKEYYLLEFEKIEQISNKAHQKYNIEIEKLNKNNSLSKHKTLENKIQKQPKNQRKLNNLQTPHGVRGQENIPDGGSIYNKNKEKNKNKDSFFSDEKKGNNKQELLAQQVALEKGSQGSDSAIKGVPKGTHEPAVRNSSGNKSFLQKVKKINGKNNKSCKKVKVKLRTRKHKTLANGKDEIDEHKETQNLEPIKPLSRLPKIKIEPNPLLKFNFPQEVFEILNHWKILGGKIPKDPNRRKIADTISNQIQELLIPGNNPYTPVLKDNELNQFRTKKWTVKEIKDTITHYKKELCKPIEQITFLQFILFRNYQNKIQKDYSPLVETYQLLPQQLSFLAKKLKDDFTSFFPEVHFYDKSFINIANFLENKLIEYKSIQSYANISFDMDQIHDLFYHYMYEKVTPKGTYEELKYMANEQNLKEFIYWCVDCNLIKKRTNEELKTHKKELKKIYKLQIKGYQQDIDNDNLDLWDQSRWDYFEYMKTQLQELSTC